MESRGTSATSGFAIMLYISLFQRRVLPCGCAGFLPCREGETQGLFYSPAIS